MTTAEILNKYTAGEATVEETNKALEEINSNVRLDPHKNDLTADEIKNGTAGLLDTGTGSMDKVYISDGHISTDCGQMPALCWVAGKVYHVHGTELVE